MARRYRNSPIIEALCEFFFDQNSPWDSGIPGILFGELKPEFPDRLPAKAIQATVAADPRAVRQDVIEIDRLQMWRHDKTALVQVSEHVLVVNQLRPYPGWESYRPMIERTLRTYREIAQPTGIQRIGLRYINRIDPRVASRRLDEYFQFYPHVGQGFPEDWGTFLLGVQAPVNGARDMLRMQLAKVVAQPNETNPLALDLYLTLDKPGAITFNDVSQWLEDGHARIEEVFEGSITERLREQFEEAD